MISYEKYNTLFSIDNYIGTIITEEEFQVLMTAGKMYSTITWMDRGQAFKVMGGDILDYNEELRPYCGIIMADSFQEAERIAEHRGWGETIDGTLEGIVDWDANPTPSKILISQNN